MRVRDGIFKLIGLCLLAGVLVAGLIFPVAGGTGVLSNRASETVDNISADLTTMPPPLVTNVLDRDGGKIATLYDQYRLPVADNQISNNMKAAIVAVEDRRFFQHAGVDPRGTLRALANDARGGDVQGASTITQQYVKNYLVNVVDRDDPVEKRRDQEQSLARKLREARIAIQVEQRMTKDQILSGYLNVVAFSQNTYGVAAAAKVFFGTTPDKLSVPQSALLAGIVNNPIVLNPWNNPAAALKRRNQVIQLMVQTKALSPADGQSAINTPLGVGKTPQLPSPSCSGAPEYAGFFCDYVLKYLKDNGMSPDEISAGGYTIKTSLDPKLSKDARAAITSRIPQNSQQISNPFAVVDSGSKTHQVRAMVSNRVFGISGDDGGRFSNIVADPTVTYGGGSTFKIFIAAAALENGQAGLDTILPNPMDTGEIKRKGAPQYEQPQRTTNLQGTGPQISLRDALKQSPNSAFFLLENDIGMPKVLDMAKRLGLHKTMAANSFGGTPHPDPSDEIAKSQFEKFQTKLSFTLGVASVSPLEMANVTSTIASNGMWCPANPILSITDRSGKPVPLEQAPCQQVISPDVAKALQDGMKEDTISGTSAQAAKNAGWNYPDFAKTGTTQTNQSVAFVAGVDGMGVSSIVYADDKPYLPICGSTIPVPGDCGGEAAGAFGGSTAGPPYFQAFKKYLGSKKLPPIPNAPGYLLNSGDRPSVAPYGVGQDVDEAREALNKAGYNNVTVANVKNDFPKGKVIGQSPQGNVVKNQRITLYVSTGK